EELRNLLEESYTDYFQLRYNTEPSTIEVLQHEIKSNEVLLEFFVTDSTLYTFMILGDEKKLFKNKYDLSADSAVNYLTTLQKTTRNRDLNQFKEHASSLFELLLEKPLANLPDGVDHIQIGPSNKLAIIPWEILLSNKNGSDYKSLSYLIKDYSISYRHFPFLKKNEKIRFQASVNKILAFAPTYKETEEVPALIELSEPFRNELRPLKWNIYEAESITNSFNGKALVRDQATEEIFKDELSGYSILHLAMHAFVDHEESMNSKLVFTQKSNGTEDGILHTFELFNMEIPAELVVLSACNTGIGEVQEGEGVISLARGFAYAGVPSLVMSHWNVNDETTSKLMVSFYHYLSEGDRKDVALRKAKLDFLKSANKITSNPFYWGGFVVLGDTSPLNKKINYWLYVIIGIGLSGLLLIIVAVKKR
ncbi:MAG: CHAT domain-containing protein, partial [Bacteroidota bacterium]